MNLRIPVHWRDELHSLHSQLDPSAHTFRIQKLQWRFLTQLHSKSVTDRSWLPCEPVGELQRTLPPCLADWALPTAALRLLIADQVWESGWCPMISHMDGAFVPATCINEPLGDPPPSLSWKIMMCKSRVRGGEVVPWWWNMSIQVTDHSQSCSVCTLGGYIYYLWVAEK